MTEGACECETRAETAPAGACQARPAATSVQRSTHKKTACPIVRSMRVACIFGRKRVRRHRVKQSMAGPTRRAQSLLCHIRREEMTWVPDRVTHSGHRSVAVVANMER
ncbi:hypothetical protein MRX96_040344 [Rhipicephalus microplus]